MSHLYLVQYMVQRAHFETGQPPTEVLKWSKHPISPANLLRCAISVVTGISSGSSQRGSRMSSTRTLPRRASLGGQQHGNSVCPVSSTRFMGCRSIPTNKHGETAYTSPPNGGLQDGATNWFASLMRCGTKRSPKGSVARINLSRSTAAWR